MKIGDLKILLYLFLLSLAACHPDRSMTRELDLANSVIEEEPDTALYMLQRIAAPGKLSGEQYATYCLLRTQAEDENNIRHTSDSMISIAVNYFTNGNDSLLKAKSYYYLGRVNEDMGKDSLAAKNYMLALLTVEKTDNYRMTGQICIRLSELYRRLHLYDQALEMQKKAYGNYLLADNQENKFPLYLLITSCVLSIVLLTTFFIFFRYYRRQQKLSGKREKQLSTAHQTISEQKIELTILKKDVSALQKAVYDNSEIICKIRRLNEKTLSSKEKISLNESEWNLFLCTLEQSCAFISRLKKCYPRLTDDDIRICALLKEGVTNINIGSIMNMTSDTLNRRMLRIKSDKMNMGEQRASLENIIRTF